MLRELNYIYCVEHFTTHISVESICCTPVSMLSHFRGVQLIATVWNVAHQAPLSMGFPRQEYWSGLPCLPPGDLPNPGIEPSSLMSLALIDGFFITKATGKI